MLEKSKMVEDFGRWEFSKREPEPVQPRSPSVGSSPLASASQRPTRVAYSPASAPVQGNAPKGG